MIGQNGQTWTNQVRQRKKGLLQKEAFCRLEMAEILFIASAIVKEGNICYTFISGLRVDW